MLCCRKITRERKSQRIQRLSSIACGARHGETRNTACVVSSTSVNVAAPAATAVTLHNHSCTHRYRLGLAIEGCAQGELCRGPEHKTTAVAKFREAHAAFAAALALAEGADKASRASMGRVETQLRELGATAQEHQNTM